MSDSRGSLRLRGPRGGKRFRLLDDFLEYICRGGGVVAPLGTEDVTTILTLRRKYADVPMDFADASLVVLAMREGMDRIVSLDSDFEIDRLTGKKRFRNLLPIR